MKYQPGDYCCVDITTGNIFGKVMDWSIRHMTHSDYNHVFIIVSERGDIIEATPFGARLTSINEYKWEKKQYSTTVLTDQQRAEIVKNAYACIGIDYGFLDIVYLGLALKGIKWNWLLGRVRDEKRMICSQLVAFCGNKAGVKSWLCGKEYAQMVTPGDLAILAQENE